MAVISINDLLSKPRHELYQFLNNDQDFVNNVPVKDVARALLRLHDAYESSRFILSPEDAFEKANRLYEFANTSEAEILRRVGVKVDDYVNELSRKLVSEAYFQLFQIRPDGKAPLVSLEYIKSVVNRHKAVLERSGFITAFVETMNVIDEAVRFNQLMNRISEEVSKEKPDATAIKRLIDENRSLLEAKGVYNSLNELVTSLQKTVEAEAELKQAIEKLAQEGFNGITVENIGEVIKALEDAENGSFTRLRTLPSTITYKGEPLSKYADYLEYMRYNSDRVKNAFQTLGKIMENAKVSPSELDSMLKTLNDLKNRGLLGFFFKIGGQSEKDAEDLVNGLDDLLFVYALKQGDKEILRALENNGVKTDVVRLVYKIASARSIDELIEQARGLGEDVKTDVVKALIHEYVTPLINQGKYREAYSNLVKIRTLGATKESDELKNVLELLLGVEDLIKTSTELVNTSLAGAFNQYLYSIGLSRVNELTAKATSLNIKDLEPLLNDVKNLMELSYNIHLFRSQISSSLRELSDAFSQDPASASARLLNTANRLDAVASDFKQKINAYIPKSRELAGFSKNLESVLNEAVSDAFAISGYARAVSTTLNALANLNKTVDETSKNPGTPQSKNAMATATLNYLNALQSLKEYGEKLSETTDLRKQLKSSINQTFNELLNGLSKLYTTLCKEYSASYCEVGDAINRTHQIKINFEKPASISGTIWGAISTVIDANRVFVNSSLQALRNSKNPIDKAIGLIGAGMGIVGGFGTGIISIFTPHQLVEGFTNGLKQVGDALYKIITLRGGEVIEGIGKWASETASALTQSPEATIWYGSLMAGKLAGAILIAKGVGKAVSVASGKIPVIMRLKDYLINLAQGDPYGLTLVFIKDSSKLIYNVITTPKFKDLMMIASKLRGIGLEDPKDVSKFVNKFRNEIIQDLKSLAKAKQYTELDLSSEELVTRIRDYKVLSKLKTLSIDNYSPTELDKLKGMVETQITARKLVGELIGSKEEAVRTADKVSFINELNDLASKYISGSPEAETIYLLRQLYENMQLPEEAFNVSSMRAVLQRSIPYFNDLTRIAEDPSVSTSIKKALKPIIELKDKIVKILEANQMKLDSGDPETVKTVKNLFYNSIEEAYNEALKVLKEEIREIAPSVIAKIEKLPDIKELIDLRRYGLYAVEKAVVEVDIKQSLIKSLNEAINMVTDESVKKQLYDILREVENTPRITDLTHLNFAIDIIMKNLPSIEANNLSTIMYLNTYIDIFNQIIAKIDDPRITSYLYMGKLVPLIDGLFESIHATAKVPSRLINKLMMYGEVLSSVNDASGRVIKEVASKLLSGELEPDAVKDLVKLVKETGKIPNKTTLSMFSKMLKDIAEDIDMGDVKITDGYRRLLLMLSNATEKIAVNQEFSKGFGFYIVETSMGRFYTNIDDPNIAETVADLTIYPIKKSITHIKGIGEVELTRKFTTLQQGVKAFELEIKFPDGGVGKIVNYAVAEPPSWWKSLKEAVSNTAYKLYLKRLGLENLYAKEHLFYIGTIYYFDPQTAVKLASAYGDLNKAVSELLNTPEIGKLLNIAVVESGNAFNIIHASLKASLIVGLALYTASRLREGLNIDDVRKELKAFYPSITPEDLLLIEKIHPTILNIEKPLPLIIEEVLNEIAQKTLVEHRLETITTLLQKLDIMSATETATPPPPPSPPAIPLWISIPFPGQERSKIAEEIKKEVSKKTMREKLELFS